MSYRHFNRLGQLTRAGLNHPEDLFALSPQPIGLFRRGESVCGQRGGDALDGGAGPPPLRSSRVEPRDRGPSGSRCLLIPEGADVLARDGKR